MSRARSGVDITMMDCPYKQRHTSYELDREPKYIIMIYFNRKTRNRLELCHPKL